MAERALATAFVNIVPGTKDFESKLKSQLTGQMPGVGTQAGKGFATGFGSSLKKLAGLAAGAFAVGTVARFGKETILLAEDVQVANQRLDQIAKSMGVFGKDTDTVTTRLKEYAQANEAVFAQDAEVIKSTQAKLLTFKNLALTADEVGGAFDRTTQAAFDLAAAGFGSAESNATQLGKALQDPIKGITALARSGVTFTEAEKARIKTLVESNQMGKAQDMVLKAIEAQVGGTAAATAKASDRMRLGFESVKETIGLALLPAFQSVADVTTTKIFPAIIKGIEGLPVIFDKLGQAIGPVLAPLKDAFVSLGPAFTTLAPQLLSVVSAFSPLGLLFKTLAPVLPTIVDAVAQLANTLGTAFIGVLTQILPPIQSLVQTMTTLMTNVMADLIPVVVELALTIGDILGEIIKEAAPIVGLLVNSLIDLVKPILPLIAQIVTLVVKAIGPLIQAIRPLISAILPVLANLLKFVIPIVSFLAKIVVTVLTVAIKILIGALNFVIPIITTIIGALSKMIAAVINTGSKIMSFFGNLGQTIVNALKGASKWLFDIGKNVIQGLIDGAGSLLRNLGTFFLDLVPDWIEGPFKKALGIASPSKVFKGFGKNIIQGLTKGLMEGESEIRSTMSKVSKWVADAVKSGDLPKAVGKAAKALVKTYRTELLQLTREHEAVVKRLEEAQDKLAERLEEKLQFVQDISAKYGAGYELNEETTAAVAIQGLKDRIAKARELATVTDQLIALGLNEDLYKQIVEAGAVDFARSIIEGGAGAVEELNVLADEANKQAIKLAKRVGSVLFDEGIAFAQSVVDGLESEESRLSALMERVAQAFANQLQGLVASALGQESKGSSAGAAKSFKGTRPGPDIDGTKKGQIFEGPNNSWRWNGNDWKKLPALAKGGYVTRPTTALIGEAGPEVVTPLKDFERMTGLDKVGAGKTIVYNAAPNQSLDSERALFLAMKRAEVIAGW